MAKVDTQHASKIDDDDEDFSIQVILREIDPSDMSAEYIHFVPNITCLS